MGWRRFFRRAAWDAERSRELEAYLQIETDENVARGMPPDRARAAARKKFGNPTLVREEIYKMNTIAFLDTVLRNLRHALRMLRRNPAFAAVALLTLAIGIGANTAVFSVVNSVLIKPLPYPDSEELVAVWHTAPGVSGLTDVSGELRLSPSMYFTYSQQNRVFTSIGLWAPGQMTVTGVAEPEEVRVVFVTDGTLQALNTPPALGRWLSPDDQVPGGPLRVMLGYGYWQRRFGGNPSVLSQTITANARPREIAGVMPKGFRFAADDADLIVPLAFDRSRVILPGFGYRAVARLKDGVTVAQANADIARLVPIWNNSWPAAPGINPRIYESWRIAPAVRPLKQDVVGGVGSVLWVVMGTIGIVLLIACANVANLLLVRAEARQQELAVRAALGAGWGRIVRELLLESVLLGVMGGVLGLGLAYGGLRLLVAIGPANLPRLEEISIDPQAVLFLLAVSVLSGLLFGLIPALKYAGPRISFTAGGGRGLTHSRERHRARSALVVGQVALALVLLVSAGLMIRTFQALRRVEPGFSGAENIQTIRVSIPASVVAEPERVARMQNGIVDQLAAIPGVASVAFASAVPMEGLAPNWDAIRVEYDDYAADETPPMRLFQNVSPGFFQTAGTSLIAGRDYTWTDLYDRRPVVMISENLARELWGTPQEALGKRIHTLPASPWREVIGVVQDVRENGVHQPAPAAVYWPSLGTSPYFADQTAVSRTATFAIRSERAGAEGFLREVQQAVWSVNASLAVTSVRTMQEIYDRSLARTSFTLVMLGIAGAMALVLGLVGIYGVISYAVSQRRREIGIRLALGAQPRELRGMFVRHALVLAGIGVAIGLGAAVWLTQLMRSLLFEVSTLDAPTYAAVALVLVVAAVLASYLPARRAAAVDPAEALRAE